MRAMLNRTVERYCVHFEDSPFSDKFPQFGVVIRNYFLPKQKRKVQRSAMGDFNVDGMSCWKEMLNVNARCSGVTILIFGCV